MSHDAHARQVQRAQATASMLIERIRQHAASLARDLDRVAMATDAEAIDNVSVSTEEWTRLVVDRARLAEVQERLLALEEIKQDPGPDPLAESWPPANHGQVQKL